MVRLWYLQVGSIRCVLLAFFICLILGHYASAQPCDPNDLSALKEFVKNLRNGSIINTWVDDSVCCKWDGVLCENVGNASVASRVTRLVLPKRELAGPISGSLGRLSQLKWLDLSNNHLSGELPAELSLLKQLTILDLSYNMFSGPAWGALSGLMSIRLLNVSSNELTGDLLKLGSYPHLLMLNMSRNLFSGRVNSNFCNASRNIHVLDLSSNHLVGDLDGLQKCSLSLRQLHLDGNSLSGPVPDFLYDMPFLEHLSISGNNFSGQLSEELGKLSSLKTLILSGNQFSGPFPNVFANLTQLEQLIAQSNSFSGSLPSTLSSCSKLHVLNLRNNTFTGSIDLDFSKLPLLCNLELSSNHLVGPLPNSLSNCHELKVLSLAKNNLSGEVPLSYVNLQSLFFLSLSNNSVSNLSGALAVLQQCKNLSTLILTENFRGEEMPKNASGFDSLTLLALGNCALSGEVPEWLLRCHKLQVLDLSWNHLTGSIPEWIGKMESLFYLDFSNNSLTGNIPKSMMELKSLISLNYSSSNLTGSTGIPLYVKRNQSANSLQYRQVSSFPPSVYLSNNKISGKIWPEIGQLKELHVLDLGRNNITGIIPDSLSNLENLEVLDLSNNNLYGPIPASLQKLNFLSKFNVVNNSLRGPIPTGGQFWSFPSSSFEGNPGLCGQTQSPCEVNGDLGLKPGLASHPKNKFPRSDIVLLTVSIGAGVSLLLIGLLLLMSKRNRGDLVDEFNDELGRPHRLSGAVESSKLVLFQSADCRDMTVVDLLKSTNNFNQANIIGCGGFGLVYKGNLPNGTKVAIKRLSGDCGQVEREFQAEVEALSRAQHKNLVSLQGYCRHGVDRLLIYSYMENGSLDYWLHEINDGTSLRWDVRLKIAQGAARGLAYLHKVCEPSIIHRDVKTSNILLDEKFEAHLADFGLSRLLRPYDTHVTTDLVGTLGYIPPEYSQTLIATFRGDVYSYGVVLLELLTGRRPVEVCKGKGCRDLVAWVFQTKAEKKEKEIIDATIWDKGYEKQLLEVLGIACSCTDRDPRRRPSIEQVVSWLDGIGFEGLQR